MTKKVDRLDEYGKQVLKPLRPAPAPEPQSMAEIRAKFLRQGEVLRRAMPPQPAAEKPRRWFNLPGFLHLRVSSSLIKSLTAVILVLVILVGSSLTVYAAQGSLPGQPLYTVKSISEDVRLSLTTSPQIKLDLILDYTDRRLGEISSLVASGQEPSLQSADRFQGELDQALQLASELSNGEMQTALETIQKQAESQGITLEQLIQRMPDQADPAIIRLQARLTEQVSLSGIGQKDPQAFRSEIMERNHRNRGSKRAPSTPEASEISPKPQHDTQNPSKSDNNQNGKPGNTSPGEGSSGKDQGKSTPAPGNRSHGADSTPNP